MKSYEYTTHYTHLDQALRARWTSFRALESDMASFVPRPKEEFRPQRDAEIERLLILNPDATVEELAALVDPQFEYLASPSWQFLRQFHDRHTTEYVTVMLLAHALSEALINAVLAIGLADAGASELFSVFEKADFKQKWLYGPKSFAPTYRFPTGTALHETLNKLSRQRNALAHLKIELKVEGKKILEGSEFDRMSCQDEILWLRRYFSLPYDLANLIRNSVRGPFLMLLFDRKPIDVAQAHVGAAQQGHAAGGT